MKNTLLLSLLFALSASAVSEHRADGASPLHHAWSEESSRLIAAGADVNARDAAGRTPLFYVNYPPKAALLLRSGADVHVRDAAGNTPLLGLEGISTGAEELSPARMAEIVRMLAAAGADMKARNNAGYNALDLALSVQYNGTLPDVLREYGLSSTPERELVHACGEGQLDKVRRLLAEGASPNARDIHGQSAIAKLQGDAIYGPAPHSAAILEALLAAGADPNMDNGAPLYRATLLGYVEQVQLLLQYGADAKLLPLRCVISPCPPQLIQLLEKAGATLNH